jgi:hypothetical protein
MARLLRHIDAIAREEGRGVIFVTFGIDLENLTFPQANTDWESMPYRIQTIEWLNENNYNCEPCGEIASETSISTYMGSVYIKVPYDLESPDYLKLQNYLEMPDGSMRFNSVNLYHLPLTVAMQNSHHDAPGFWDKWAEDF